MVSVLRVEVDTLALQLQEGGGRLISQAALQGVDARLVAYPITQDILFAVAKVGPPPAACMLLTWLGWAPRKAAAFVTAAVCANLLCVAPLEGSS